ncbi:MFS transporter OS=Streptomyces tendae OX=1932 GN=GUR47_05040 PE=4 SV=1 [Streptomyces tendae]
MGVALLGAGILALMLPLVLAEGGGLTKAWWLFPGGGAGPDRLRAVGAPRRPAGRPAAPGAGAAHRDPRLRHRRGCPAGALYFVGFSGVWLVFALFFQNGLGYSPLMSGLAVTPFAVGSAVAAAVGGAGLVERLGRLLTVWGLVAVMVGLGTTALLLWLAPSGQAAWLAAPALLLGGLGSGCVISPNITMTLRDVPVRMAGAAGGALQTGQRLGGAVGTAALPGLFYLTLNATHDDYHRAVRTLGGHRRRRHAVRADRRGPRLAPGPPRRRPRDCPPETSHSHTHAGQH